MDWAEKYRPMHLADILGNGSAVRQIVDWAKSWTPDSRPLLFTGKPGIGKTSSALALARDMEWEVMELNASDARTKAVIEHVAGNSATTMSLFGTGRKLIIIDEVDNLEGNADRGGARAIADILKEAQQPVILIANDAYGVSDSIRKLCDPVPFRAITAGTLANRLREICAVEYISCGEDAIKAIAESSAGDLRSAVNMLFGSSMGKSSISAADINTAQKDERSTIFDLVAGVYTGAPDKILQKLSFECDEKPDAVMQWIEESLPLISNSSRRIRAYGRISRADVYLGRTMRRQYYMMWRYATSLMTLGVAAENAGAGFRPRIMPPSRWKRMSTAKKQKAVRRTLSASLSEGYHIPESQIRSEYLDLLARFAETEPVEFCERHNLDVDQMTIVLHDKVAAQTAVKEVQRMAKERDMKVKKLAAAKKAELRKLEDEAEAARIEVKIEVPEPVIMEEHVDEPAEESVDEKKSSSSQATLDFF